MQPKRNSWAKNWHNNLINNQTFFLIGASEILLELQWKSKNLPRTSFSSSLPSSVAALWDLTKMSKATSPDMRFLAYITFKQVQTASTKSWVSSLVPWTYAIQRELKGSSANFVARSNNAMQGWCHCTAICRDELAKFRRQCSTFVIVATQPVATPNILRLDASNNPSFDNWWVARTLWTPWTQCSTKRTLPSSPASPPFSAQLAMVTLTDWLIDREFIFVVLCWDLRFTKVEK